MNIYNTFFIYFLLLLIFKIIELLSSKKLFFVKFIIIFLFVLWVVHPYWLYGNSSAIGWFDEVDLPIFNFLILSKLDTFSNIFVHELSGGSKIFDTFYYSKLNYFFLTFLFKFFPEFLAISIYRIFSSFAFIIGFMTLFFITSENQKSLNYRNQFIIFISSLLGIYSLPYEYGWTVSGQNFLYSSIIWFLNIIIIFNKKKYFFLILLFYALLITLLGVSIIYFLPCSTVFIILFLFFKIKKISVGIVVKYLILFYFFYFLFNHDTFFYLINFDARFSLSELSNFNRLKNEIINIVIFFTAGFDIFKNENFMTGNFFPPFLFIHLLTITLIIFSSFTLKNFKNLKILIIFTFIIFFIQCLKYFLPNELNFIKSYSFVNIYIFCYPFVALIFLEEYLNLVKNKNLNILSNGISIILTFLIIIGLCFMNYRSVQSVKDYGGWDLVNHKQLYKYLNKIDNEKKQRVVSLNNNPKSSYLNVNGVSTFDGLRFNHKDSKSIYFHLISNNKNLKLDNISENYVRHQINSLENINYNLLAIAGIKFIISKNIFLSEDINLIKEFEYKNILTKSNIYIYELKKNAWDIVFVPNNIVSTRFTNNETEYYDQLKNLGYHSILIDNLFKIKDLDKNNLKILKYKIKDNKIFITTNLKTGFFVINSTYVNTPNFICDGEDKKFKVLDVNLIMQLVELTSGCRILQVKY